MMGAGLQDQDLVSVLQLGQVRSTFQVILKISFIPASTVLKLVRGMSSGMEASAFLKT